MVREAKARTVSQARTTNRPSYFGPSTCHFTPPVTQAETEVTNVDSNSSDVEPLAGKRDELVDNEIVALKAQIAV